MIPKLQESTLVGCFGPVASGKTFLCKEWARPMTRVVVFDPTMEWGAADEFEEFNFWEEKTGPRAFVQRLQELDGDGKPYRLAVHPRDIETSFTWTVNALWQPTDVRWLIIEEIHEVMNPQSEHFSMRIINKYARKRFLGVIGASQRIADVHKNFTSASRLSVVFGTDEPRDVETIRERFGDDAAMAMRDMRRLEYNDATGAVKNAPEALVVERGKPFTVEAIG